MQHTLNEIHVLPSEAEGLSLAQPECNRDGEQSLQAVPCNRV